MSKGSKRRKEDTQKVLENWDSIFGKKKVSITDLKNVNTKSQTWLYPSSDVQRLFTQ